MNPPQRYPVHSHGCGYTIVFFVDRNRYGRVDGKAVSPNFWH
jgi:hypothetical protein